MHAGARTSVKFRAVVFATLIAIVSVAGTKVFANQVYFNDAFIKSMDVPSQLKAAWYDRSQFRDTNSRFADVSGCTSLEVKPARLNQIQVKQFKTILLTPPHLLSDREYRIIETSGFVTYPFARTVSIDGQNVLLSAGTYEGAATMVSSGFARIECHQLLTIPDQGEPLELLFTEYRNSENTAFKPEDTTPAATSTFKSICTSIHWRKPGDVVAAHSVSVLSKEDYLNQLRNRLIAHWHPPRDNISALMLFKVDSTGAVSDVRLGMQALPGAEAAAAEAIRNSSPLPKPPYGTPDPVSFQMNFSDVNSYIHAINY